MSGQLLQSSEHHNAVGVKYTLPVVGPDISTVHIFCMPLYSPFTILRN